MRFMISLSQKSCHLCLAGIRISFLIAGLCCCVYGQGQGGTPQLEATTLQLNKPFDGHVGGGRKQSVSVELAADQYAVFQVESESVKVGVTRIEPNGGRV